MALVPDTVLAERNRVLRVLGTGGNATVYLADDVRDGRRVAVKVLRPELHRILRDPDRAGEPLTASFPRGQQVVAAFHRFGLTRFASRFPNAVGPPSLDVIGRVTHILHLPDAPHGLPRVEQVSDFHCVTTWSVRQLRWEGVRFADFFSMVVVPHAQPQDGATLVAFRGHDGARTAMSLEDLLAPDVLLADRLNGAPLTRDHGAPLRLVAPAHYGYKSVKHLHRLELRFPTEGYRVSGFRFMDHPRARVAMEERGRVFPGWLLRYLYRPLISPTVALFARASNNEHGAAGPPETVSKQGKR